MMHKGYLLFGEICFFFAALGLALAQTTVTTSGGTTNSLPKFSNASTIVDSAVTETNGNVFVGPVMPAVNSGESGILSASGNAASLGFVRRTLTSWPSSPVAGDAWYWYNPDGTARLWTYQTGDVLTLQSGGSMSLGPIIPTLTPGQTSGVFTASGNTAALGFLRRTLTSWPSSPVAGDAWYWYSPDGTSRLWTSQVGDTLVVKTNGEVDLTGPLRFADGSLQTKAQAIGPQGPAGPQGPQGAQGPPGPAIHTSAVCAQAAGSNTQCSCSVRTIIFKAAPDVIGGSSCTVTSDTGTCSASGNLASGVDVSGACCVCAPN